MASSGEETIQNQAVATATEPLEDINKPANLLALQALLEDAGHKIEFSPYGAVGAFLSRPFRLTFYIGIN